MFIVFGIKRMNKRLATMLALCGQCGTPAAQVVTRLSTWFSLFFIPVIPLGNKYVSTCTLCGKSVKIDKDQAMQMVAATQQVSSQPLGFQAPPPDPLMQSTDVPTYPSES